MSDKEETDRVRISQVLAGALAAVTAALIGSTMGVAGTVVGAGLASIVSTIGGALYLRSIERTTEGVRTVRAKVVGKSGGTTVLVSDEDPDKEPEPPGEEVEAEPVPGDRPPADRRRLRWPMLVVASLAAFALGMLAVTGVEWLRGETLSGGNGTTFGSIVDPKSDNGEQRQQPSGPTTSTTTPTAPESGSEQPTSTTTGPTSSTTTTTPPSDSSTTTTTTTPPETTTTEVEPPGGSVIPTN
ncbi:hypothetical protein [Actinophytocola sp. KF-1]